MRVIISLEQPQLKAVDTYAETKGVSRAQIVREALAVYLPAVQAPSSLKNHAAFGAWKGDGSDSVAYIRKLRSEWDKAS